jgi:hypothetical protein
MQSTKIDRGIAVLALTAALALAGARPAAAQPQEAGFFERGLRWIASILEMPMERRAPEPARMTSAVDKVLSDKGLGVDPNGETVIIDPSHRTGLP